MHERDKFYAFALLGAGVMILALVAVFFPIPDGSGSQRIVDAALGGILLALGGASQALFRTSQVDADNAASLRSMTEKAPSMNEDAPAAIPVKVVQPPGEPVPVIEGDVKP